jgi:hypothetical protein
MSCSKDKNLGKNQEITDYVKNNLTTQKTSSGLYVVINEEPVRNPASNNVTVPIKVLYGWICV